MMSKMKSSNLVYWKTLIILPVIMLALALSGSKASSHANSGKDVTYTGKVTEAKTNEALPGASVIIKGTTIGTQTDINGDFKIIASEDCTLYISFVGFETYVFKPGEKHENWQIHMKKSVTQIEETTVIPGNKLKKDGKDIPENVLVIVDGKEVSSSYLKTTDPNSIESMNILKDESATKKYGEKGKNGVILISTKKVDKANVQDPNGLIPPPPPPPPPSSGDTLKFKEAFYYVVEQTAEYEPGDSLRWKFRTYVAENFKYPEKSIKDGVNGTIIVQFIVNKHGLINEAKVIRGIGLELDKAAIEVLKSSHPWRPAMQGGKNVAQLFTMPINIVYK